MGVCLISPIHAQTPTDVAAELESVAQSPRVAEKSQAEIARTGFSPGLARMATENNRRTAESRMAAIVIGAIGRDPGNTPHYVATAVAVAPSLKIGIVTRVTHAYPGLAATIESAATGGVPQRPVHLQRPATQRTPAPAPRAATPAVSALPQAPAVDAPTPSTALPGDDLLAEADTIDEDSAPRAGEADPLEDVNRAVFFVNDLLDTYIIRPIAWTYGAILPERVKQSVRNVIRNLGSPAILANDLLQFEFADAGITLGRFAANSTIGLLGVFEVAEDLGLPYHEADFGQTLHAYEVGAGPYLVLPVLGPASVRDGVGKFVDGFFDPFTYLFDRTTNLAIFAGKGIVRREDVLDDLDTLRRTSIDYYAALRTLYYQDRASLLRRHGPARPAKLEEVDLEVDQIDQ